VGFLFYLNRNVFRCFPQLGGVFLCKSQPVSLYHLILLLMNYLSRLQVSDSKEALRQIHDKIEAPSPQI